MNSKRFIRLSLCMTLALLIIVASAQIAIDPLFQYHKPWFGMEPVVKNERYQDAGVAKTFEYDNVLIGNSLAENFRVSDVNEIFGGDSVKLTMSGSHSIDWTFILDILEKKSPDNIMLNLDPGILFADPVNLKHELPVYLYDFNYTNDVNYLLNFSIIADMTYKSISYNIKNRVPDYNDVFIWNEDIETNRENAIKHYDRPEKGDLSDTYVEMLSVAEKNIENLEPYFDSMSDTEFVFFYSPFSILHWDSQNQVNKLDANRTVHLEIFKRLLQYNNVKIYFWDDQEILNIICDLNNYADEMHFNFVVCSALKKRMIDNTGLLTLDNYKEKVNNFFDFLDAYDYNAIFDC